MSGKIIDLTLVRQQRAAPVASGLASDPELLAWVAASIQDQIEIMIDTPAKNRAGLRDKIKTYVRYVGNLNDSLDGRLLESLLIDTVRLLG